MNREAFESLFNNYDPKDEILVSKMALLIEKFPYFQLPRFFYAKSLKDQNKNNLSIALNQLSLYTADREVLKENIESKFKSPKEPEQSFENKTISIENTESIEKVAPNHSLKEKKTEEIDDIKADHVVKENPTPNPKKTEKRAQKKSTPKEIEAVTHKEDLKLSFIEWIEFTEQREKDIVDTVESQNQEPLIDKLQIINQFIKANPKIQPLEETEIISTDLNKKFDSEELMTETLAKLLFKQKKYKKAIQAYRVLSLKYPEKNVFFAKQIEKIKNLQKQ